MRNVGLVFLALIGVASAADAATICVQLDASHDQLNADERASAQLMFENGLRAANFGAGGACDETWTLMHVMLGGGVQVLVVTPSGALTASTTVDQLPTAYEGLVWRGLALRMHAGATPSTSPAIAAPGVESTPSVAMAAAPPEKSSAGAFYVRIGYAAAPVSSNNLDPRFGPTIGAGYRRAVDSWLFDVSVLNTHAWRRSGSSSYDVNFLSFGRIAGYWLMPRDPGSSFYLGGGLSFGQSAVQESPNASGYYGGSTDTLGIQVEAAGGYEFMQDRSVRVFLEANLVAPLTKVETETYGSAGVYSSGSHWAPTLQLSAGIGF